MKTSEEYTSLSADSCCHLRRCFFCFFFCQTTWKCYTIVIIESIHLIFRSSVIKKSIEVLVRRRPVMVQMRVVERWDVFRVRTSAARSRGAKVEAVAGSRWGQSGIMHRVMIVPVWFGRLLLSPGKSAVQAHGRTVLALVIRAAVIRRRPPWRIHGFVPTVGMGPQVNCTGSGLIMWTGEPRASVRVRMDRERGAWHVKAGSIWTLFSQEIPGVKLQTACHQVGSGLRQAFAQHLHIGDNIWTLPVA